MAPAQNQAGPMAGAVPKPVALKPFDARDMYADLARQLESIDNYIGTKTEEREITLAEIDRDLADAEQTRKALEAALATFPETRDVANPDATPVPQPRAGWATPDAAL